MTVVGPGGKSIPEALVEIWGDLEPSAEQILRGTFVRKVKFGTVAKADADGKLVVSLPKPPDRFILNITIPGFGPYWACWRTEDHDPPIPARFTAELDRAWSVGGIIVDPEGKPIQGVKVGPSIEFKRRPGDDRQIYAGGSATTDAAGRWRYDSVPDSLGEVYVAIDHPNFSPVRRRLARAEFGIEGGKEPSARLTLDRGLTVTGHVVDDEGKPIAGALIRTKFHNEIREAKTGADGSYRLLGCEARPTRIVASAKGRAADLKELNIEPGMGPVDFRMQPGGTVRVRVLDHEGKPAAGARIFFQQWRGRYEYFELDHVSRFADANGVWEWHEAPPDELRADINPPDGNGMNLKEQPLIAREEDYVFRLPPTLVISGKVVDAATKQPIKSFRVIPGVRYGERNMGWVDREAFSATEGRYEVRQIPRPDGPSRQDRGRRLSGRVLSRDQEQRGERHDRLRAEPGEQRRREGRHPGPPARERRQGRPGRGGLPDPASRTASSTGTARSASKRPPTPPAASSSRRRTRTSRSSSRTRPATPRSSRRPSGTRRRSSAWSRGPGWKGPSGSAGTPVAERGDRTRRLRPKLLRRRRGAYHHPAPGDHRPGWAIRLRPRDPRPRADRPSDRVDGERRRDGGDIIVQGRGRIPGREDRPHRPRRDRPGRGRQAPTGGGDRREGGPLELRLDHGEARAEGPRPART